MKTPPKSTCCEKCEGNNGQYLNGTVCGTNCPCHTQSTEEKITLAEARRRSFETMENHNEAWRKYFAEEFPPTETQSTELEKIVEEFNTLVYNLGISGGVTSSAAIDLKEAHNRNLQSYAQTKVNEALRELRMALPPTHIKPLKNYMWHKGREDYRREVEEVINSLHPTTK